MTKITEAERIDFSDLDFRNVFSVAKFLEPTIETFGGYTEENRDYVDIYFEDIEIFSISETSGGVCVKLYIEKTVDWRFKDYLDVYLFKRQFSSFF